jgi:hypothetical protein
MSITFDAFVKIVNFLPPNDWYNIACTSKEFHHYINTMHDNLWNSLHVNTKVDAKDVYGKWYEGTVIGISNDGLTYSVHFKAWGHRFDEDYPYGSLKIAPHHTYTCDWYSLLKPGSLIEVIVNNQRAWYKGIVTDINPRKVRIHSKGKEEWYDRESSNICCIYTHTYAW